METANPLRGLDETEPDDDNGVRKIERYNKESGASLVCRYGAMKPPMLADAVLMIKLTQPVGTCIFTYPRGGRPASMRCHKGLDR